MLWSLVWFDKVGPKKTQANWQETSKTNIKLLEPSSQWIAISGAWSLAVRYIFIFRRIIYLQHTLKIKEKNNWHNLFSIRIYHNLFIQNHICIISTIDTGISQSSIKQLWITNFNMYTLKYISTIKSKVFNKKKKENFMLDHLPL